MPTAIATLTTARLLAEALAPSHFSAIHRLHTDPLVMKTLSADGKPLSEKATRESIRQAVGHWHRHGFGFWVFHRRSDGVFIGRGGLIDGRDGIGLVLSEYWNQGFATEMGEVSLDVGFGRLGFNDICSWTLPGNLASQRAVCRYEREFEFAGLVHRLYRVAKGEWKR